MSKVITFSRQFPSYHPRKGEPTYFVEQIWNGFRDDMFALPDSYVPFVREYTRIKAIGEPWHFGGIKHHTIRSGHRWKAGDWFKPVVWQLPGGRFTKGNKQIQFAPDIQIKKVWNYHVYDHLWAFLDDRNLIEGNGPQIHDEIIKNDGLSEQDFIEWFRPAVTKGDFRGQIICWADHINY